jgi:3-dehydroquinate synthase
MVVPVNLGKNSYDVVIERGGLSKAEKEFNLERKVLIVTDSGVPIDYAGLLSKKCAFPVVAVINSGEENKTLETMQTLFSAMVKNGFTRKDAVVAVGGGLVGDLAGFVAATYMRGIDFYNVPTTVLSCVDSSVGGKTAVNFDGVKNIIGAFWQPKKVLIDVELLGSLPARQISNGLAESVKMALTFDREFFKVFQKGEYSKNLEQIILRSVQLKAEVVEKDERESGLRKVLNFGHTIGHGIELCSQEKFFHGECVALGMLCMVSQNVKDMLVPVLERLGLPRKCNVDVDAAMEKISHDKKGSNGTISCILVNEPGTYEIRDMGIGEIERRLCTVLEK